ncbi:Helix-turn-helix domain-containing protein [Nocardia amikacinitolerans]|uniref:Helix-turn-helix domain-containing protein n=1 Tax=Nocardia amikacinitolerans TaxID=756689 RepID=A0A285LYL9_9NOCA|nr:helix-turn-helix transcriptional regulator [Nocardia amikacinitolerans]SNY89247.1 Helix-turn-helix domain-containing protein [Nocardia amikacinitolerans]
MTGSTLPRRMLGRQLRMLREKSGVSAEFAREAIGVGKQTLWRMETGQPVRLNPLFIERLCEVYGAGEDVTRMLLGLTEEAGRPGWWHAYGDAIPKHFDLFVGLEEAAKRIVSFQTTLLPGLLQTDAYRRALLWVDFPTMSSADVERRIEMFMRRKAKLDTVAAKFEIEAVIDESALRRAIGGPSVMADQLNHLAKVGERSNVSLRVVPLSAETYCGLRVGPFVLLEFPRHPTAHLTEPPVVYIQGLTGALYLEKVEEVLQYRQTYADIQRSALDESRSLSLIREIAEEYVA